MMTDDAKSTINRFESEQGSNGALEMPFVSPSSSTFFAPLAPSQQHPKAATTSVNFPAFPLYKRLFSVCFPRNRIHTSTFHGLVPVFFRVFFFVGVFHHSLSFYRSPASNTTQSLNHLVPAELFSEFVLVTFFSGRLRHRQQYVTFHFPQHRINDLFL